MLDELARLPRREAAGVRWTTRAQWHVTLRFVGDVDAAPLIDALEAVRAPRPVAALASRTSKLGRGVLCVRVTGLDELASAVIDATDGIGRPPEHRPFRAHLTLARVDGGAKPPLVDVAPLEWPVATFALVRSHLGRGPARYETVSAWDVRP